MMNQPLECPECGSALLSPVGYQFKTDHYLRGQFKCKEGHEISMNIYIDDGHTFLSDGIE